MKRWSDYLKRILAAYEQDFSKHAPNEVVPRIRMLWNSIPAQLTKENKNFIYGLIKEGARAKDYELALLWLSDCGLVHKVHRVTAPNLPLKAYADLKSFKLFIADVGLLSCMTRLRADTLLDGNDLFREFKGALTEQYVLQQLKTLKNIETYYWTNARGNAEMDFIIDNGSGVIPIEVKAEVNLQAKRGCGRFSGLLGLIPKHNTCVQGSESALLEGDVQGYIQKEHNRSIDCGKRQTNDYKRPSSMSKSFSLAPIYNIVNTLRSYGKKLP